MRALSALSTLFILISSLHGQAAGEITGAGYAPPEGIVAAPGQVLTLFVRGINVPDAVAPGFPLPTKLSGLSVEVKVLCCNPASYPTALPLFKVHSEDTCSGGRGPAPCPLTQVAVEIPTEPLCVRTSEPNSCTIGPTGAINLNVTVNGAPGEDFPVSIVSSNPHLLNMCDSVVVGSGVCNWVVTHADGSPVLAPSPIGGSPAKPGETIVLYAVGLGFGDPSVPDGTAARTYAFPGPLDAFPFLVTYGLPTTPGTFTAGQYFYPSYVGLVAGYVGLYQVNFTLPTPPAQAGTGSCIDTQIQFARGGNAALLCMQVP